MMMAAQNSSITTNQLADSNNPLTTKKIDDATDPEPAGGAQPARRKPSSRRQRVAGCHLSNSLRADRRGGLAATKGRLSVSFTDQKGLSASDIGEILSGGFDDDGEPEASLKDLVGANKKGSGELSGSLSKRAQLATIQSQRSVTFNFDPKELEESDEE